MRNKLFELSHVISNDQLLERARAKIQTTTHTLLTALKNEAGTTPCFHFSSSVSFSVFVQFLSKHQVKSQAILTQSKV